MKYTPRMVMALLLGSACRPAPALPQASPAASSASGNPRPSLLSACRGPAGADSQLLDLVARCAGLAVGPGLKGSVATTGARAVRVSDSTGSVALALLRIDGAEARVVALAAAAPDGSVPVALRTEQLQGAAVLVEQLRTSCDDDGLRWPERPAPIGLGLTSPPGNPDCPRLVERVWRQRGETLDQLGAYAIGGEQRVSPNLNRRYSGKVAFEADQLTVTDQSQWLWLGAPNRDQLWTETYRPVIAAATSSFRRVYRLDSGALVELSGIEPIPPRAPASGQKVPTSLELGAPCAPP